MSAKTIRRLWESGKLIARKTVNTSLIGAERKLRRGELRTWKVRVRLWLLNRIKVRI